MTRTLPCIILASTTLLSANVATADLGTVEATLLRDGAVFNGPNTSTTGPGPEGDWFNQIEYDFDEKTLTVRSLFDFEDGRTWIEGLSFDFVFPELSDQYEYPYDGGGRFISGGLVIDAVGEGWSDISHRDVRFRPNQITIDAVAIGRSRVTVAEQSVTIRFYTIPEPMAASLLIGPSVGLLLRRKR